MPGLGRTKGWCWPVALASAGPGGQGSDACRALVNKVGQGSPLGAGRPVSPPTPPPAALPSGFPAVWEPGGSRGGHPSSEFDLVSLLGNSFLCPSLVPEHTNTWEQTVSFPRDYWRPVTPGCSVSRSASSSTSLRPHASWRGCWPPGRPRCPHAAGGAGHWLLPRLTWRQGLPGATVTAACDGEGPVGPEVLSSW